MNNTLQDELLNRAYERGYEKAQQEWVKERSKLDARVDNLMEVVTDLERVHASSSDRYLTLFEQWREVVQSEAQLKRVYDNLLDDFNGLLTGRISHRRRTLAEVDVETFPQPSEELVS